MNEREDDGIQFLGYRMVVTVDKVEVGPSGRQRISYHAPDDGCPCEVTLFSPNMPRIEPTTDTVVLWFSSPGCGSLRFFKIGDGPITREEIPPQ